MWYEVMGGWQDDAGNSQRPPTSNKEWQDFRRDIDAALAPANYIVPARVVGFLVFVVAIIIITTQFRFLSSLVSFLSVVSVVSCARTAMSILYTNTLQKFASSIHVPASRFMYDTKMKTRLNPPIWKYAWMHCQLEQRWLWIQPIIKKQK